MTSTYEFDGYEVMTYRSSMQVTSRYETAARFLVGPTKVYIDDIKLDNRLTFLLRVFSESDRKNKSIAWKVIKREVAELKRAQSL